MEQRFFVAVHKSNDVWKKSSSGGAFTAITDVWFELHNEKAVIYGCAFDEKLQVTHIRAIEKSDRDRMRGSKYVASNVSGIFKMVEADLNNGFFVVFSGTPCQIAGLKSYLKAKRTKLLENLLTVDVVCHGVGSNRFFEDYIRNHEEKRKSRAVSCSFRAKSRPGKLQDMEIVFENGDKYVAASTKFDWFYSVYLNNLILRPSCYDCKYAKKERESDITIADSWGVKFDCNEKNGSFIVANSEFGGNILNYALESMEFRDILFEQVSQPHMLKPAQRPLEYVEFWNTYEKYGYMSAQKRIGNNTVKGKIKYFAVLVLNKLHLIEIVKRLKK